MKPVVRNIQNNELYFFNGENNFQNIRTGIIGKVTDDVAARVFKFNMDISLLIEEFPLIEDFIKRCNLKFSNT